MAPGTHHQAACSTVHNSLGIIHQEAVRLDWLCVQRCFHIGVLPLPTVCHKGAVRRRGLGLRSGLHPSGPLALAWSCDLCAAAQAPLLLPAHRILFSTLELLTHASRTSVAACSSSEVGGCVGAVDGRRCTLAWSLCQTVEEEASCFALVQLSEGGFCF